MLSYFWFLNYKIAKHLILFPAKKIMSRFEEIVIESDDNDDKISEEGFSDDQTPVKAEYEDIVIEDVEEQ